MRYVTSSWAHLINHVAWTLSHMVVEALFTACSGVLQGSVLGWIIFCMFASPVGEIINQNSINHHCYTVDIQLYMSLKSLPEWSRLQLHLADIIFRMSPNKLKLNQEKFSPKSQNCSICSKYIKVGPNYVKTCVHCQIAQSVNIVQWNIRFNNFHISYCCFHIPSIGKIRTVLPDEALLNFSELFSYFTT